MHKHRKPLRTLSVGKKFPPLPHFPVFCSSYEMPTDVTFCHTITSVWVKCLNVGTTHTCIRSEGKKLVWLRIILMSPPTSPSVLQLTTSQQHYEHIPFLPISLTSTTHCTFLACTTTTIKCT